MPHSSRPTDSAPFNPLLLELTSRPAKVAILGFGTVGRSVAEILSYSPDPRLQLTHVFNRDVERKRVSWMDETFTDGRLSSRSLNSDVPSWSSTPSADCIAAESGFAWRCSAAKSVITANKQFIAHRGRELAQLAFHAGRATSVRRLRRWWRPVLLGVQEGLAGDRLVGVSGILNGTCNYILSRMEAANVSFDAALHRGAAVRIRRSRSLVRL